MNRNQRPSLAAACVDNVHAVYFKNPVNVLQGSVIPGEYKDIIYKGVPFDFCLFLICKLNKM